MQQYFETARKKVLDRVRELVAVDKNGYMVTINLLVKVFPNLKQGLLFIGFLRKTDAFLELMHAVPQELDKYPHSYILTDSHGFLQGMTEGLTAELGLFPRMMLAESTNMQKETVNIEQLVSDANDPVYEELYPSAKGQKTTHSTMTLMSVVEAELLTAEENRFMRQKRGSYKVYL